MIGYNNPMVLAEGRNKPPVVKGPGWVAMQHDNRRRVTRPFVEIMIAKTI
jgi:hypothetical protein